MAATLTADNGSTSGSSGLKWAGDASGVLSLQSGSGVTGFTLDANQNVGIGVTPSAWSGYTALQTLRTSVAGDSGNSAYFSANWYNNAGDKYIANGYATQYVQYSGVHAWKTAPSSTAGSAISFTQAMTLTNAGYLGIGTSSPGYVLDLSGSASPIFNVNSTNTNGGGMKLGNSGTTFGYIGSAKWILSGNLADLCLDATGSNNLIFATNDTERMRLDLFGNLGLGVTPSAWASGWLAFQVKNAALMGNGNESYLYANGYFDGGANRYISNGYASRYVQSSGQHQWMTAPSSTAGSAISFTQAMTLDNSGRLLIGTTSASGSNYLQVNSDASIHGLTVGQGGGSVSTNTAVGTNALAGNSSGIQNVAIGYGAINSASGNNNVALGYNALNVNTGSSNVGIGLNSLIANSSGSSNVAVGQQALQANTTGSNNTAVGYQAAYYQANTSSPANTAIGYQAMYGQSGSSTGYQNTAVGQNALYPCTSGYYNVAVGANAGLAHTSGQNNTYIGYNAGSSNTSANGYTCVGYNAGSNAGSAGNNSTYIGNGVQAYNSSTSNEIVIGTGGNVGKGNSTGFIAPYNGGVYQGNNSLNWSQTSDQRLKKNIVDNTVGLSAITQIKVRNFEYRLPDEVTDLDKSTAINITGVQLGVIAQELQTVLPDCVKTESTGVMSVDASNITWHLINAVKELNNLVTTQATAIATMQEQVTAQAETIAALQARVGV
jgi:hypothetical protein